MPPPKGDPDAPLQALIIDSWFDNYVGVVSLVRVMNGSLRTGQKIRVLSTGRAHQVDKLGRFTPKSLASEALETGEVGFVIAGIKEIDGAPVGDTITLERARRASRSPGFKQVQPRVFAGLFPVKSDDYENFRDALAKLRLNDSALHYEPEVSTALGFGFRCGFLGLLHMDIVQERLEREYNLTLITSAPTVVYEVVRTDGTVVYVDNPSKLPPSNEIAELREPHHHGQHPGAAGVRRRRASSCARKSAACRTRCCTSATRCRCSTSCRWPRWCWISSTG